MWFELFQFMPWLGPVTIADQAAEESMVKIIEENFPSHAMWVCAGVFSMSTNG